MATACLQRDERQESLLLSMIQPAQVETLPLHDNLNTRLLLHLKGKVRRLDTKFYSAQLKKGKIISAPLSVGSVLYQDNRYEFHENGMVKEVVWPTQDWVDFWYKQIYYYDSLNRITAKIDLSNRDSIRLTLYRYYYNKSGQMINIETFNHLQRVAKLGYTDGGQTVTISEQTITRDSLCKTIYTIDQFGNTTSFKRYLGHTDSPLYEVIYERNQRGTLLSETMIDQGSPSTKIIYHYDSLGNPEYCEDFYGNIRRGLERYEYTFDQQGNWTRKIIFVNNVPWVVVERGLEYF
jgi:hypothetical protein